MIDQQLEIHLLTEPNHDNESVFIKASETFPQYAVTQDLSKEMRLKINENNRLNEFLSLASVWSADSKRMINTASEGKTATFEFYEKPIAIAEDLNKLGKLLLPLQIIEQSDNVSDIPITEEVIGPLYSSHVEITMEGDQIIVKEYEKETPNEPISASDLIQQVSVRYKEIKDRLHGLLHVTDDSPKIEQIPDAESLYVESVKLRGLKHDVLTPIQLVLTGNTMMDLAPNRSEQWISSIKRGLHNAEVILNPNISPHSLSYTEMYDYLTSTFKSYSNKDGGLTVMVSKPDEEAKDVTVTWSEAQLRRLIDNVEQNAVRMYRADNNNLLEQRRLQLLEYLDHPSEQDQAFIQRCIDKPAEQLNIEDFQQLNKIPMIDNYAHTDVLQRTGQKWQSIKLEKQEVQGSEYVAMIIEDAGTGFPQRNIDIQGFELGLTEYANGNKGTGVGMAVRQHDIESLGGKIKLENPTDDKGRVTGSRLTIYIPTTKTS